MVVHLFNRSRTSSSPPIVPTVPDDERVYAIGDIHGRHDLLIRLLARIHEDATRFSDGRRVRIVFLGDYIDRGEDSRKVLDALLHLMAPPTGSIVVLRGNHEAALLDFLDDPLAGASWLEFGGLQTLASFGIAAPRSWSDRRGRRAARDALW